MPFRRYSVACLGRENLGEKTSTYFETSHESLPYFPFPLPHSLLLNTCTLAKKQQSLMRYLDHDRLKDED